MGKFTHREARERTLLVLSCLDGLNRVGEAAKGRFIRRHLSDIGREYSSDDVLASLYALEREGFAVNEGRSGWFTHAGAVGRYRRRYGL